jgi:hypothetical protein
LYHPGTFQLVGTWTEPLALSPNSLTSSDSPIAGIERWTGRDGTWTSSSFVEVPGELAPGAAGVDGFEPTSSLTALACREFDEVPVATALVPDEADRG